MAPSSTPSDDRTQIPEASWSRRAHLRSVLRSNSTDVVVKEIKLIIRIKFYSFCLAKMTFLAERFGFSKSVVHGPLVDPQGTAEVARHHSQQQKHCIYVRNDYNMFIIKYLYLK